MMLPKDEQKIMEDIFKILDTTYKAMKWEIILPIGFFKKTSQDLKNGIEMNSLKEFFIELSVIEYAFSKPYDKKTIKVFFGKRKIIQEENQELTVHYKYASKLLSIITNSTYPLMFTVQTRECSLQKKLKVTKKADYE